MSAGMRPPAFDTTTPLATLLLWPALPAVLRRALTRAVPRETLEQVSLGESVSRWREPMFREWIVGLLALDVGVGFSDTPTTDDLIGLFANDRLGAATIAHFFVGPIDAGQGFGAAYRAGSADAPASVCAAAFVYVDAGHVESAFVFLAGATKKPVVQLALRLDDKPFDAVHIERAARAIAAGIMPAHRTAAREVVREALEECRAVWALGSTGGP
jgi:hypothetical protein